MDIQELAQSMCPPMHSSTYASARQPIHEPTSLRLTADVGMCQKPKHGEELCGDSVQVVRAREAVTVIMSDGLGSGVKASILATLTTSIAKGLLQHNIGLDQIFETIADTLPVCKVRGIAYSTLAIVRVSRDGTASFIEYDNPDILVFRDDRPLQIQRTTRIIAGREVREAKFQAREGDVILLVSDGVIHAGVGCLLDLGLGQDGLVEFLPRPCTGALSASDLASKVIELADSCYLSRPCDDITAAVLKVRRPEIVSIITGPPADRAMDSEVVHAFMNSGATRRVVCGGTTGQMVARELGTEVRASLDYVDPSVPPTAVIPGVDLTTEGILTLNRAYERLRCAIEGTPLPESPDGATLLARTLLSAEEVRFMVGLAQNPAHANLDQLVHLDHRAQVVAKIAGLLERCGVQVQVRHY